MKYGPPCLMNSLWDDSSVDRNQLAGPIHGRICSSRGPKDPFNVANNLAILSQKLLCCIWDDLPILSIYFFLCLTKRFTSFLGYKALIWLTVFVLTSSKHSYIWHSAIGFWASSFLVSNNKRDNTVIPWFHKFRNHKRCCSNMDFNSDLFHAV